jgi:hypothetical protein
MAAAITHSHSGDRHGKENEEACAEPGDVAEPYA